jgi:hypothetical protein
LPALNGAERLPMEEYEIDKQRRLSQMRTIANYGMGTFFVIAGIFFLVYNKMGITVGRIRPSPTDILIGILFILYGSWRIYRGYKKNYFK